MGSTMSSWPRRGREFEGEDGANFLRAEPNLDLCNGFFVALLKKKKKKRKSDEQDTAAEEMSIENHPTAKKQKVEVKEEKVEVMEEQGKVKEETSVKDKKKKKKKLHHEEATEAVIEDST